MGLAEVQPEGGEDVDAGVKEPADDGRGFVFDDDGGAADQGARAQFAPLVDWHLDKFAGFGVEDSAEM